jgi:hypothetical protein
VRRFHKRLRRLESITGKCPGDPEHLHIRMYRATRSGAKNIPPHPPCKLCGKHHRHEDGTIMVKRIIITIPDDSELAQRLGPEGWRLEPDFRRDGGQRQ